MVRNKTFSHVKYVNEILVNQLISSLLAHFITYNSCILSLVYKYKYLYSLYLQTPNMKLPYKKINKNVQYS